MNRQEWVYGALAGAIGGAIGWLPAEFLAIWRPEQDSSRYLLIVLYFVLVGGCIGAAIGAADGVRSGQSQRARRGALLGAGLGLVGGALGSLPGEFAFQALQSLGLGLVGRAVGWAVVGIFIGAVHGALNRDRVRLVRGGLGGLLGGYLGGGAFEIISQLLSGGAVSRWIAVVLLGLFLGALIAIFERWLSTAQLTVITSGKQEGNRLNLTKPVVSLGCGDRDDFVLYAGEGIRVGHAQVLLKPDGYWVQPQATVYLNRQPIDAAQRLHNGQEVGIGSLTLRFSEDTAACPHCGVGNPARAEFCRGCGQPLPKKN